MSWGPYVSLLTLLYLILNHRFKEIDVVVPNLQQGREADFSKHSTKNPWIAVYLKLDRVSIMAGGPSKTTFSVKKHSDQHRGMQVHAWLLTGDILRLSKLLEDEKPTLCLLAEWPVIMLF